MSTQNASAKAAVAPKLALLVITGIVITGLATLDRFLAKAQEAEVHRLAQRSYLDGLRLRRAGKTNEAVEAFRKAHALERRNKDYELELIDGLLAAGKPEHAELLMRDVLEREPNDGRANLLAAHVMIARGRTADAESYYHRAIYGEWPSPAARHRASVRMELADFLAANRKQQELLPELLPLQAEAGNDTATELHLAELFLVAGTPLRAAEEYREVIEKQPENAAAYAGLGEAELQRGEYPLAHEAFLKASALNPEDPAIRRQLALSEALRALDPSLRKLTSMEKYQRGLRILDLARSSLERCIAGHPAGDSEETRQLLTSENERVTKNARTGATNEIAEQVLGLAEKTWQTRIKVCGPAASTDEEPLRLIMQKLAQ